MSFVPAMLALALSAPPAPAAEGAFFYHWIVQTQNAVRQTEFGQMLSAVLSGSTMGSGDGWFKPRQGRFGWKWLAERYDADHDGRITRQEFTAPKELFDRLDRDRNGVLTESDLDWSDNSTYLRQLGLATQW